MAGAGGDVNNQPIRFTCENSWFRTDVNRQDSHPHGCHGPALGSVFSAALATDPANGNTLWLEYVVDRRTGYDQLFWLIWYDPDGCPQTVASAVIDRSALRELAMRLVGATPPATGA